MQLAPFALLGVLLAAVQFATRDYDVELDLVGASTIRAMVFHFARIAFVVACFGVLAVVGFRPLLAGAAGFASTLIWLGVRGKRQTE
jgi:hypothetical protein